MPAHPPRRARLVLALLAPAAAATFAVVARGDGPRAAPPRSIGGVEETVAGLPVSDPFRGLEDRAAAASWIDAHTASADAWFAAHPDPALDARLEALTRLGSVGSPHVVGGKTFFTRLTGAREQPVVLVREGGVERTLLDPQAIDPTGKTAVDGFFPSRKGGLLVYLTSPNGTEESVLHLLDVATGKDLGLSIPDTRWTSLSWLPDDTGFYYTRYPAGVRYDQRVWFHRVGDDPAKDVKVFGDGRDKTDFPAPLVSEDGLTVAYAVERGWSATDLYVEDRATGKRTTVVEGHASKLWPVRIAGTTVWAMTNRDAPRFRLVRIDLAHPAPEVWVNVRPEGADTLESATWAGSRFVVKTLDPDAVARLSVLAPDGTAGASVPLPEAGGVFDVDADPAGPRTAFGFSSFGIKSAIYEFDASAATPALSPVAVITPDGDRKLTVRRERYASYDGTRVPVWIASPAGAAAPGPVYLEGYGGFSVTLDPTFSSAARAWIEKGGTYVLANLRGGNEFGEAWHQAGMRDKKFQVFEDMEHVMRGLIASGVATPRTLGIEGGSNGGLLMGAMMTRCPQLFAACVGNVGLYDMMRFQLWPPAELWVDEYGSSADPAQARYLLAYSPYHNVLPGIRYPAFLGATAEEDTRVTWRHTAKFVAALEAADAGGGPILFRMETKAGHGQGKNRSDRVKELSRTIRFLWTNTAGAGGPSPQTPGGAAR